jgi:hypothetical protein
MSAQPSALEAFLECLHVIEALPPSERARVIQALENFRIWSEKVLCSGGEAVQP